MKRHDLYIPLIASLVLFFTACDANVPEPGTMDVAVQSVVLDESIADGLMMAVGTTLNLESLVSVTPEDATDRAQYYFSSDPDVASVSAQGVLAANQPGSCSITVNVGQKGVSAFFDLTVLEYLPVDIVSMEFTSAGLELINELDKGRDLMEFITVNPSDYNEKILWTSSNDAVVSVSSDGKLTVVGVGEAVVTATAQNHTSVRAELPVTVLPKPLIDITALSFTVESKDFMFGVDKTFNLRSVLTVEPGNQTEGLIFESSDSDVVSVDEEGNLAIKALGNAVISVKAKDHPDIFFDQLAVAVKPFSGDYDRALWTMTCSQDPLPAVTGRNNSLTAMLDNEPTTVFCVTRPGKSNGGVNLSGMSADEKAAYEIFFVLDLKEARKVNYFRITHLSTKESDRVVRLHKISQISGSNDGIDFTPIASGVDFLAVSQDITRADTGNISIPESEYRYFKFLFKGVECYDPGAAGSDGARDNGNTAQIQELYLGFELK